MFDRVRLVWNLTARCGRKCAHCAAAACKDMPEDVDTKFNILYAIMKSGLPVDIDFSGGDPWRGVGGSELMQAASAVYGREHISVSSVGVSVWVQKPELLQNLASSYDFTYDQPFWYDDPVRKGYNLSNYIAMDLLDLMNIDFAAVIPIRPMTEQLQDDLIRCLLQVHTRSIKLLRLMPVGRNRKLINEDNQIADALIKRLRTQGFNGTVTKNCATTGCCNGLSDHKLGLDYHGDLYWCIWAADLPVKKQQNPFYMGNLLEEPLLDILGRHREKAMTIPRNVCHVLEYIQSYKGSSQ